MTEVVRKDEKSRKIIGGVKPQIEWMAVLRGVAALLVFISHLKILPLPGVALFTIGRVGVVCFFLITGYLTIQARSSRSWKQYLFNRVVRIYPIYWILLSIKFFLLFKNYSIREYLLNLTLFEEFLGLDAMIGESWMLPIQLCFFVAVAILGSRFFVDENGTECFNTQRGIFVMAICTIFSLALSILRCLTSKPFPTAFFLLMSVSILGIYYKHFDGMLRKMIPIIVIFEIGLIISVFLSYPNRIIAYILAYNIGLTAFVIFQKLVKNISLIGCLFMELGKIGYTFFLGASIPWIIFERYYPYAGTVSYIVIGCVFKFVTTAIIALCITHFIEQPLLKWEKKIEKEMRI